MYGSSMSYKKHWFNFREILQVICLSLLNYTSAYGCEGFFKGCCPGSTWNSISQQCERCMPGYTGENCSKPCPYPYYGVDCQRECKCSRNSCDVFSGYIDYSTDTGDFNKCRPGYVGKHCRARCIYPYYGEECEAKCNCSERMCNVATGCKAVDRALTNVLQPDPAVWYTWPIK